MDHNHAPARVPDEFLRTVLGIALADERDRVRRPLAVASGFWNDIPAAVLSRHNVDSLGHSVSSQSLTLLVRSDGCELAGPAIDKPRHS